MFLTGSYQGFVNRRSWLLFIHRTVNFCRTPRFQKKIILCQLLTLFCNDLDIVDAIVIVHGFGVILIADSPLLLLPGLCSLPPEFHDLLASPTLVELQDRHSTF